ncbi:MAG: leucyl aminopeptidase family protein, partial [Proteobacteria bacterium]|nr:leucyl aminopeptidase family protein [Pseudomonadota bacterium]
AWLADQPKRRADWVRSAAFKAKPGEILLIPSTDGAVEGVLVGLPETPDLWSYADVSGKLPPAIYRIEADLDETAATGAAIGWALADYRFDRYKKERSDDPIAVLAVSPVADWAEVRRIVEAISLVRDLVNTPAEDMGPQELAAAAGQLANAYSASCEIVSGQTLLDRNLPAIHAVGRASNRPPCLIDLVWGDAAAPKVTLVGKGVCFDSGGLNLKSASGMRLMKKDMGGSANVLGLAKMIMDAALPVRLRVLIPAVENAVAGNAIRPGDVVATRKGLTIEIGNTDAEGRVVLADALAVADEEGPDLLIDCATLTGAARVALGPSIPPFYTPDDELAQALGRCVETENDPMWRMPLWAPYREMIDSKVADISNSGESPFAGSITAALFLKDFVTATTHWLHIDLYAWNPTAKPGRQVGGEAQGIRALYKLIKEKFGQV